MYKIVFTFILLIPFIAVMPQAVVQQELPDSVYSGKQGKLHVQGTVVDPTLGVVYFSFTDKLIKTDLQGNVIGSVTGIVGILATLPTIMNQAKFMLRLNIRTMQLARVFDLHLELNRRAILDFILLFLMGRPSLVLI